MCTQPQPMLAAALLVIVLIYLLHRNYDVVHLNLYRIIFPKGLDHKQQDLASAAKSYAQYPELARRDLSRMRKSYCTIGRQHKRIGYDLGYPRKLNALEDAIEVNALVTRRLSELEREGSATRPASCGSIVSQGQSQKLGRMLEVLKHFVRDWSEEGVEERSKTFSLVLDELEKVPALDRKETTVLVPGAGLARLPWEIALLGFNTTSNELSPYMNLAFRFLLSRSTTSRIHQHVIQPFAHWFSHQRSNASLFRSVTFPDVLPSLDSRFHHEESDFLSLAPVGDGYDYIVTHYFIDTSHNIITTLQKIHHLLRHGGTWINLGPLLWMSGAQATMELSLEEVLELSRFVGFHIRKRQTVPSEYTRDSGAMMRWIYEAEFWIAVKT